MSTSKLADVPPEVLGQIVIDVAACAGIGEAWYLRQACRKCNNGRESVRDKKKPLSDKIYDVVQYEIMERLPLSQFMFSTATERERVVARSMLRINLLVLLRSPLRDTAQPTWPVQLCKELAEKLIDFAGPGEPDATKDNYVQVMTTYLTDVHKEWSLDSILRPRSVQSPGLHEFPLIAVAALVGRLEALQAILGQNTEWYSMLMPYTASGFATTDHEPPFWEPLTAAIWGGHDQILAYLLSMFASWCHNRWSSWTPYRFRERLHAATETVIQLNRPKALRILIKFHDEQFVCRGVESSCPLQPKRYHFNGEASCLDRYACLTAKHGSINALRLLLHIQGFKSFDTLVFGKACRYGQLDFIRRAIHKGMWRMSDGIAGNGGLTECARHNGRDIAELLIDSGTDVRSSSTWQMAVRAGDVPMLRYLAERGAPVGAYDFGQIRLHPNEKETKGLWNDCCRVDKVLAHYVALKMDSSADASSYTPVLKRLLEMVEGSPQWQFKALAAMSVEVGVSAPGTRLYGQFLVDIGF